MVAMIGSADAKVPRNTFPFSGVANAKAEALKESKALVYYLSDSNATLERAQEVDKKVIKELRSYAVIIYLEADFKEVHKLTPPLYTAMQSREMGNFYPKFIVMDPSGEELWESVSFSKVSGAMSKSTFRSLKKSVGKKLDGWEPTTKEPTIPDKQLKWPATDPGRSYTGKFVEIDEDKNLVLEDEDGDTTKRALARFSDQAMDYARELHLHLVTD